MTHSQAELEEMRREVRRQPPGRPRFEAWDALLRHADAAGATEFAFVARLDAVEDFEFQGDSARALLAFSWCLAAIERRPDLLTGGREHDLLWKFKWMVSAVPEFPDIPLDRIQAVLDDMERRYRLGGHSLHAVFQHRLVIAVEVGDLAGAEGWYDRLLTAPRDGLSDCAVCVPSTQIDYLVAAGRYEEAVRVGDKAKRGRCMVQPQWILGRMLEPYLATGRLKEAVDAHRTGYGPIRTDGKYLGLVALHLVFCGRTGNEAGALALVERHLPWLERPTSPAAERDFAAGAALVLGRLCAAGEGGQVVARRSEDGSRRWTSTVAELQAELAARATALAARFDARNGNDHQGRRIAGWIGAEPVVERLPLTVLAGRSAGRKADAAVRGLVDRVAELVVAGDGAGEARARLDVAYALRNVDRWLDAAEAAEEAVLALDRAGLAMDAVRGRYLLWELYRRSYEHHTDAFAVLDRLLDADVPADLPPVESLLEEGADLLYGDEAAEKLYLAADRHRTAGRFGDELRLLRKAFDAAEHPFGERDTRAMPRAVELAARPDAPAAERARIGLHVARTFLDGDRPADGLDRVHAAIGLCAEADLAEERLEALLVRAQLLLAVGRFAEAEEQARFIHADDDYGHGWQAGIVVVHALRGQGRAEEATEFMRTADIDDWDLGEGSDKDDAEPEDL